MKKIEIPIYIRNIIRIQNNGLHFYFIFFIFISFLIILHFSIFRALRLGLEVIGYTVTSVTSDGVITILIMELERRE